MKYVVVTVLDQTIGFYDGIGWTTVYKEALLYDNAADTTWEFAGDNSVWIEEIEYEEEFRSRPDTW